MARFIVVIQNRSGLLVKILRWFLLLKRKFITLTIFIVQNAPKVTMDSIVQTVVKHATIRYVDDMKEIVQMDVLKGSKDISVLTQVYIILKSIL